MCTGVKLCVHARTPATHATHFVRLGRAVAFRRTLCGFMEIFPGIGQTFAHAHGRTNAFSHSRAPGTVCLSLKEFARRVRRKDDGASTSPQRFAVFPPCVCVCVERAYVCESPALGRLCGICHICQGILFDLIKGTYTQNTHTHAHAYPETHHTTHKHTKQTVDNSTLLRRGSDAATLSFGCYDNIY